ncbi:hypothetical protein VTN00DRAFT_723 [Thermoascus crustaceus]|uniref:uncharacterized protein n=1 Tax=Thermoascus crustaceus TaxID=5088 RepID=UPI003743EAD3
MQAISPAGSGSDNLQNKDIDIQELNGAFVTPGLIDMHSHHLVDTWPGYLATGDVNEMHPVTGPLTPFVRALDSIKPYDQAATIIASGGVTSSLVLPGSANIMGGEGVMVKNLLRGGDHREENVEELLLEHGVPEAKRRRYMKMACGENPRRVYGHTRMGNAWIFRNHMTRAADLRERQDAWCASAAAAGQSGDYAALSALLGTTEPDGKGGGLPEDLELDSTVAMLRGKIGVNIHCYESEDMEDMILHSKEFGFRIQAFHHSLSSWKVPEMIKSSGENITIATFSDFGLYKKEAYDANLRAGKVLAEHGVPVAYKSDHGAQDTNAKYILSQAATAHSFGLPEIQALQSVTSVPARSLEVDHRIGFVKPGYDADIVVWNSHPLTVGATPLQVYIDGKATLDPAKTRKPLSSESLSKKPKMRPAPPAGFQELCSKIQREPGAIIITGITRSYLDYPSTETSPDEPLTMTINSGRITCLGHHDDCISTSKPIDHIIKLEDSHVLPGLTAFSSSLGLVEIPAEPSTSDGTVSSNLDPFDPNNIIYAKYGVHLEGRAFERARIGGVTKAVTAPIMGETPKGFLGGVSVGIKTSGNKTILDGGIFKDDVALHFIIGQEVKASAWTPTVSSAIAKLRRILFENKGKDSIYGKAADGLLPVVVHSENKDDILQLIKLKRDHGSVKLVIYGGAEAPAVAHELAASDTPIIFTAAHGAPDTWERKDALTGPPLTRSPVQVLSEANVTFGLAFPPFNDWRLHNLLIESSWAAVKDAGLSPRVAVDLVSRNIERILGTVHPENDDDDGKRDFVVYEGDPLEYGARVVLAVDGGDDGGVAEQCPGLLQKTQQKRAEHMRPKQKPDTENRVCRCNGYGCKPRPHPHVKHKGTAASFILIQQGIDHLYLSSLVADQIPNKVKSRRAPLLPGIERGTDLPNEYYRKRIKPIKSCSVRCLNVRRTKEHDRKGKKTATNKGDSKAMETTQIIMRGKMTSHGRQHFVLALDMVAQHLKGPATMHQSESVGEEHWLGSELECTKWYKPILQFQRKGLSVHHVERSDRREHGPADHVISVMGLGGIYALSEA